MNLLREFGTLTKYRLSLAVTVSSVTGYLIGHPYFSFSLLFMFAGVLLLAGGSAALNQYTERETDALMTRTRRRPIPSGKIEPFKALIASAVLFPAGTFLLLLCGVLPAILGIITVVTYNFIYTPLKRVTHFAIFPGALVGAIPPLIGYFAAEPASITADILAFAGFMFMWQIPHFWLINSKYSDEYQAAGLKSVYPHLSHNSVRFLIFTWMWASVIGLSILTTTGTILQSLPVSVILSFFVIFLAVASWVLFRKPLDKSGPLSFILVNSFSIAVMILFIAGSFS